MAGGPPADHLPTSHPWWPLTAAKPGCATASGSRVIAEPPLNLAINRYVADQLVAFGVEADRIEVIPNGITIQRPPVQSPASEDLLALARHNEQKSAGSVSGRRPAAAPLASVAGGFTHRWAGRASSRPWCNECIASYPRPEQVQLIDALPQAQLLKYLRSSLALLSASTEEGFDYPVLEAKAEGIPTLIEYDIPPPRISPGLIAVFSGG